MLGSVTCQKVCQPEAPSVSAASSSSVPCACISGISSRATNGKVTKIVASTMPGTAKMILMSCACSHGPNQPWAPKTSTKMSPATTGETENGRSISVISSCLPRNSNLAIAQAAATPKTRFSGTAIAAANQRQLDRRQRVGLGERVRVGLPALAQRLGEHRHQRQQQEEREECQREGGDRHAAPRPARSWRGVRSDEHGVRPSLSSAPASPASAAAG